MTQLLLFPSAVNFSPPQRLRAVSTSRGRRTINPSIKVASIAMCSSQPKQVWIWTENKSVMTAAVERGWNTFLFTSQELAQDWSSLALLEPLLLKGKRVVDRDDRKVATVVDVMSSEKLMELQQCDEWQTLADNLVINFHDWQIISAENAVAAFQGSEKTIFAVSKTSSEAQIFLEALENGLGGVVLRVDEMDEVVHLKKYFDKRNESGNLIGLTTATVTKIYAAGMGDRVCVDLCSLMRPGEGILVGSFARGLFLVHSECLESNYIASRPFRVNAGPVHAYVVVPGGKTRYLSELRTGKEVIVVDQMGRQRTATVGRVKIETRPLILIEAKIDLDSENIYSILLQNAETVALICPSQGNGENECAIPVTSLKVGDNVKMRLQGGARHTGIEIQEFIVEK